MTGKELLNALNGPRAGDLFASLYGSENIEEARRRYAALTGALLQEADFPPAVFPETAGELRVFTAPGRTELGGNHTDHNRGRVLAASIQLDAAAVVAPRRDKQVFFRSAGFPDVQVNLAGPDGKLDLSPKTEEQGTTESLVRGIAAEFAARGVEPGGFTANAASTVLQGSGLSSSAAVEVLFAVIFDCLYGGGQRGAVELAQMGQKAENVFFGKPSGLMDQAASASGGAVAIDFANPAAPLVRNIPFDPLSAGFVLCVVNTRGSHADLTPDYAAIPQEMNAAAGCFGKTFLRETSLSAVLSRAPEIRAAAGDRALLRAIHFFNEDRRAGEMAALLETFHAAPDADKKRALMDAFMELVNESGRSSGELLQNIYSTRNPQAQGISVALALTREFFREHGVRGACRVHGGGFAGTIQAYIPAVLFDSYRAWIEAVFGSGAVTVLRIRPVGAAELVFDRIP
ncbi:MAG: galactokinase [Treponema sp.]|jgi:galactokinase|nr:galactokinase [Treponema sp.]